MNAKNALLAAAAAALFAGGITAAPGNATAEDQPKKVHCEGVNACKGQTDCGADSHECSGQNACKGKGWKKMTAAECDAAKKAMSEK